VLHDGAIVMYEANYRDFVREKNSPKTESDYIADLRRVSRFMRRPVCPRLLNSDESIRRIGELMKQSGENPHSVNCCQSAMRAYLQMARKYGLSGETPPEPDLPRNGKTLPFTFIPSPESVFKEALLNAQIAYIVIYYKDGRREIKVWNARNFRRSSNLIGNLRSRAEFRRDSWQRLGIARVEVSIQKPQGGE
jgi:hypothetical protein